MEVVPSRGRSPAALRRLVRDAADSYQNMLRVWGGASLNRKHVSPSGVSHCFPSPLLQQRCVKEAYTMRLLTFWGLHHMRQVPCKCTILQQPRVTANLYSCTLLRGVE